jgi:hypothetical protein
MAITSKSLNAASGQVKFFEDLASWMKRWGFGPAFYPSWKTCQAVTTRKVSIRTLTFHHTAGDGTTLLTLFRNGNGRVPAPLANIAVVRGKAGQKYGDGEAVIGAAGYTNSEGNNDPDAFNRLYYGKENLRQYRPAKADSIKSMNRYGISVEVCATGKMSEKQLKTSIALAAAFCVVKNKNKVAGAEKFIGYVGSHKELTRRKPTDPAEDMGSFRAKVLDFLHEKQKENTPVPAKTLTVIIVPGSANTADGALHGKYRRRLDVALQMLNDKKANRIMVTGGVKAGHKKSEAEVAKAYLLGKGVPESKILVEDKSGSTNGNFVFGLPIAKKAGCTHVKIVSDFSHMRRCLAFRYAAEKKLSTRLIFSGVGWFKDKSTQDATVSQTVEQSKSVWSGMTADIVNSLDSKWGTTSSASTL